jgi:2-desacetyl-2-hydroxyethyl bacteriochlorophyllide A dehydrogenase
VSPATPDRHTSATATAVRFTGPRRVELAEVDLEEPGDGEVAVRTLFSGISSGSEMLAYRGELPPDLPLDERLGALSGTFRYPFRYGYSCVGRVERSRAGLVPEGGVVFAFHPHQDRFVVGASELIAVGDVDPRAATMFPLVETALQVVLDAGPVLGTDVVVLGLGVVGLLTAALLARGGGRVLGVDPIAWRRDVAATMGIEAVAPDEVGDAVTARAPVGVPLAIEVTGRPEALASSLALLAHEGVALVVSWYGTKDAVLPLGADFHRRRLTIRSTQVSTIPAALADRWTVERRRAVALGLLADLPVDALATHTFPFAQAEKAFSAVDGTTDGLVHAALWYE